MFKFKEGLKLIYIQIKKNLVTHKQYSTCYQNVYPIMENVNIGLHSLRSASGCAAVAVYEQCWKKHGRWASDLSEDRHVKDRVKKHTFRFPKYGNMITNKRQSDCIFWFILFSGT